jgi:hypothetical protein
MAARHGKTLFFQIPSQKRRQHVFDVATHLANYTNPIVSQSSFQRLRNSGANERVNAHFHHSPNPHMGHDFAQRLCVSANLLPIGHVDQQQAPGDIEDWRHTILPDGDGDFHGSLKGKTRAKHPASLPTAIQR